MATIPNFSNSSFSYELPRDNNSVLFYVISLLATIANLFAVVASVRLVREHPVSPNVFVLGLSCVDFLCVLLACIPSWLCYGMGRWTGGQPMCDFQGFMILFATLASGSVAMFMAIDRCVAVTRPLYHRQLVTVGKTTRLLVGLVVIAFVVSLLPVLGFGSFSRNLVGTFCTVNWFPSTSLDAAFCFCYVIIGDVICLTLVLCNTAVIVSLCSRGSSTEPVCTGRHLNEMERQFVKTMAFISLVFVACWIPYMSRIIGNAWYGWRDAGADLLVCRLLLVNLLIDPFTYVLTRQQYRDLLVDLFCFWRRSNRIGSQSSDISSPQVKEDITSAGMTSQALRLSGDDLPLTIETTEGVTDRTKNVFRENRHNHEI